MVVVEVLVAKVSDKIRCGYMVTQEIRTADNINQLHPSHN